VHLGKLDTLAGAALQITVVAWLGVSSTEVPGSNVTVFAALATLAAPKNNKKDSVRVIVKSPVVHKREIQKCMTCHGSMYQCLQEGKGAKSFLLNRVTAIARSVFNPGICRSFIGLFTP
jgi:hypothetical protein